MAACGGDDGTGDGAVTGGTGGGDGGLTGGSGGSGGSGGTGGTGGTGGGAGDAGGGTAYKWLAIVDDNPTYSEAMCMMSTGPGPDIDAVELKRGGATVGVGLSASASFAAALPGGPTVSACSMCGTSPATMGPCTHSGMAAAALAEGARNATADNGYISLNSGVVWLQIGSATGSGTAQDIQVGDTITVHEVDQLYEMQGVSCVCAPEKYTVYAYVDKGDQTTRKRLTATMYRGANNAMCGALDATKGCGTSDFTVP